MAVGLLLHNCDSMIHSAAATFEIEWLKNRIKQMNETKRFPKTDSHVPLLYMFVIHRLMKAIIRHNDNNGILFESILFLYVFIKSNLSRKSDISYKKLINHK